MDARAGEDGTFRIQLPADLDFDLVAGPPRADESTAADSTTEVRTAAPDAEALPDPARSVRLSGLRTADVDVEMKLPVALDGG
jgi:hypothetical protein